MSIFEKWEKRYQIESEGGTYEEPEDVPEVEQGSIFDQWEQRYSAETKKPELTGKRALGALKEGAKDVARQSTTGVFATGEMLIREDKGRPTPEAEQAGRETGMYIPGWQGVVEATKARGVPLSKEETQKVIAEETPEKRKERFLGEYKDAREYVQKKLKTDPEYLKSSGFWEDVIRMGPQMGSQVLATVATGGIGGMAFMGAQIAGGTYEKLVSQGVDPDRAIKAGIANAILQAPMEQLGIGKSLKFWKVRGALSKKVKELTGALVTEWGTEFLQGIPDAAVESWATTLTASDAFKDFLKELPAALKKSAKEGLTVLPYVLLGGGPSMVSGVARDAKAKRLKEERRARDEGKGEVSEGFDEFEETEEETEPTVGEGKDKVVTADNVELSSGITGVQRQIQQQKAQQEILARREAEEERQRQHEEVQNKKAIAAKQEQERKLKVQEQARQEYELEKKKDLDDFTERALNSPEDLMAETGKLIKPIEDFGNPVNKGLVKPLRQAHQALRTGASSIDKLKNVKYEIEELITSEEVQNLPPKIKVLAQGMDYVLGQRINELTELESQQKELKPKIEKELGPTRVVAKGKTADQELIDRERQKKTAQAMERQEQRKAEEQKELTAAEQRFTERGTIDMGPEKVPYKGSIKPLIIGERRKTDVQVEEERRVGERRKNLRERKRIEELTEEEAKKELRTDDLTGLGNKRSLREARKKKYSASIDMDSLKYINDNFGHRAGDRALKLMGQAFANSKLSKESYHISGDEFVVRGDTTAEIDDAIKQAKRYLQNNKLVVKGKDGKAKEVPIGFSHGIATTLGNADVKLRESKQSREKAGLRAGRGTEPPGIAPMVPKKGKILKQEKPVTQETEYMGARETIKFAKSTDTEKKSYRPGEWHKENFKSIKAAIQKLSKRAKGVLPTTIVKTSMDLPEHIRKAQKIGEKGQTTTVQAILDRDAKRVYLVANNINGAAEAIAKWMHEQVGHTGIFKLLEKQGIDKGAFLDEAYEILKSTPEYKRLAKVYEVDVQGKSVLQAQRIITEEVIAKRAEAINPYKRRLIFKKFRDFINKWLGRLFGLDTKETPILTVEDIDDLLKASTERIMTGEIRKFMEFDQTHKYYKDVCKYMLLAHPKAISWYDNHQKRVREIFGNDAEIFNVLLALTSPSMKVQDNTVHAVQTYLYMHDKVDQAGGLYYGLVQDKVKALIEGDFDKVTGEGFKIQEFIRGLTGDSKATVNDRWMRRIFFGDVLLNKTRAMNEDNRNNAEAAFKIDEHMASRRELFRLAKELTKETDRTWTPREVQATLWMHGMAKATGIEIQDGFDYGKALDTPVPGKLNGRTPLEWLQEEMGDTPIGTLHTEMTVPENERVSRMEKKYQEYLAKRGIKPIDRYSTTPESLGMGIHYKKTPLKKGEKIKGTPKDQPPKVYSQEITVRQEKGTDKYPYMPLVYFYEAGAKPETHVRTGATPHGVTFNKDRIYDLDTDTLDIKGKTAKIMKKNPNLSDSNVTAKLISDLGDYDGYVVSSRPGNRWIFVFNEAVVTHPTGEVSVGISDVVESVESLPQDTQTAEKLLGKRARTFYKRIKEMIKQYPEITVTGFNPTLAQFDIATSGKVEMGGALNISGPLGSMRAFLSQLGHSMSQNYVYMMHNLDLQGDYPANGMMFDFNVNSNFKTVQDVLAAAQRHGLDEYNLVISQTTGRLSVKQYLWEDADLIKKFEGFFKEVAEKGAMRSQSYEVHSESLDASNYEQNLKDYYGDAKGKEVYDEATKQAEKYRQELKAAQATEEAEGQVDQEGKDDSSDEPDLRFSKVQPPKKTTKAYKLVRVIGDKIYPLFVGADKPFKMGEWIRAEVGKPDTKKPSKVKSLIGALAYRPGFHSGDVPVATHIGAKIKKTDRAPSYRRADEVWAEIEVGNDFDWQSEANKRALKTKDGKIVARTAHITDQVPEGGHYRYKTNPNMTGNWIISGEMRINRLLSDAEVKEINNAAGVKDLPRKSGTKAPRVDEEPTIMAAKDYQRYIGPKTKKQDFNRIKMSWADKIARGIFDSLKPLEVLEKGRAVKAEMSGYKSMNMLSNFPAMLNMFLKHGQVKYKNHWFSVDPKSTGIEGIVADLGKDTDDFFAWMTAQSAQELINDGRKNLFGLDEDGKPLDDQAFVDDIMKEVKPKKSWEKYRKQLRAINKSVLDFCEECGMINPETRAEWERFDYIPFYRVIEDPFSGDVDQMVPPKKQPPQLIKQLRGGKRNIGDPLANLVNGYSFMLNESLKNLARKKSLKLALDTNIVTKLDYRPEKAKDIVTIRHKGKAQHYAVHDKYLYSALVEIDEMYQGMFSKVLSVIGAPKRWLTTGVTLDPAFRLANFFRDTLHTAFMDRSFIPLVDSFRGLVHSLRNSDQFKEYAETGGAFSGAYHMRDVVARTEKQVTALKKRLTGERKLHKTRKYTTDLWNALGEASENAARVGMFMKQKKRGASSFDAAYESKDLLDFHKHGSWAITRLAIQMIPFLNARLQGLSKLKRTGFNKKTAAQFWMKGMILGAAALLVHMDNDDDERYQKLPDHEKRMYWHRWIGDYHLRIPVPFEVGAIFGTFFPVALTEYVTGQRTGKELGQFGLEIMRDTFNLLQWPQFLKPWIDQYANKDSFTGAPIEQEYEKGLSGSEVYDSRTSKTARVISKQLEKIPGMPRVATSPKRMEKLFRDYFGYLTTFTTNLADLGFQYLDDFPEDPAEINFDKWARFFGPGRFVQKERPRRYNRSAERFYKLMKEVDTAWNDFRHFKRTRQKEKAKKTWKEKKHLIKVSKKLQAYQRRISDLNKRIRIVELSRKYSPEEKRRRIDKYNQKRLDILDKALKKVGGKE